MYSGELVETTESFVQRKYSDCTNIMFTNLDFLLFNLIKFEHYRIAVLEKIQMNALLQVEKTLR